MVCDSCVEYILEFCLRIVRCTVHRRYPHILTGHGRYQQCGVDSDAVLDFGHPDAGT